MSIYFTLTVKPLKKSMLSGKMSRDNKKLKKVIKQLRTQSHRLMTFFSQNRCLMTFFKVIEQRFWSRKVID